MFHTFHIHIPWTELIKRTFSEIGKDNVLGLAAQLAYYFLLSLVPAILFVVALTSFLPSNTLADFVNSLRGVAPPDVVEILRDQLASLSQGEDTGLLTLGLLLALWSSSAAMVSIIDALNRAYDIEDARPWWKVRLTAILLTVGVAMFIVAALAFVFIGPGLVEPLFARIGLGSAFAAAWNVLRLPLAFAAIVFCIGLIFYFAPDAEQDWEWITPGAVLATVLWLLASFGFKIYVANFGDYNESYGSLGGVIVLMLWFYISALAVLTGAELNAEIEHASPHGKDPGEKVPGQRRKLGCAARRAWEARTRLLGDRRPAAAGTATTPTAPPATAPASTVRAPGSAAAYAVLAIAVVTQLLRGSKQSAP